MRRKSKRVINESNFNLCAFKGKITINNYTHEKKKLLSDARKQGIQIILLSHCAGTFGTFRNHTIDNYFVGFLVVGIRKLPETGISSP